MWRTPHQDEEALVYDNRMAVCQAKPTPERLTEDRCERRFVAGRRRSRFERLANVTITARISTPDLSGHTRLANMTAASKG